MTQFDLEQRFGSSMLPELTATDAQRVLASLTLRPVISLPVAFSNRNTLRQVY